MLCANSGNPKSERTGNNIRLFRTTNSGENLNGGNFSNESCNMYHGCKLSERTRKFTLGRRIVSINSLLEL